MSTSNPSEKFDHNDMNAVIRLLGSLGWLVGNSVVDKDSLNIRLSEKGVGRMREIRLLLNKFPGFFADNNKSGMLNVDDLKAFYLGLGGIDPGLCRSGFSGREWMALIELVASFSSDEPGGHSVPHRT